MPDDGPDAYVHFELARRALADSETDVGLALLRKCLSQARRLADTALSAGVLFELGYLYNAMGRRDEAVDAYEECLLFLEQSTLKPLQAATLGQLAQVYRLVGRTTDATDAFGRLAGLYREAGDRRNEGCTLNGLGLALLDGGDPAGGLRTMIRGIALVRAAAPDEADLMIDHVRFLGRAKAGAEGFRRAVEEGTDDGELRLLLLAGVEG